MAQTESARAEAFAKQADRSREIAAGYIQQAIENSRAIQQMRASVEAALKAVAIAHRWNGTMLELLSPAGVWVTGPDLRGLTGPGVVDADINEDGHLVLTMSVGDPIDAGKVTGEDGDDGDDGVSIIDAEIDGAYHLILTLSNSTTIDAGYVRGLQGLPGSNGISVTSATVDGSYHLIITLSNGATLDAGYVRGASGAGTGDVSGPASSTDGAIVGFNGGTGKTLKQLTPAEVRALLNGYQAVATNVAFTLTVGTDAETIRHTGTLTADRVVTLATAGVAAGARFRIVRTGGGAFNLNVGTGPLKALRQGEWGDFLYDGSAWYLEASGSVSQQGLLTSDSPQFAGINVGHASDTTITRLAAGRLAVEGNQIIAGSDLGGGLSLVSNKLVFTHSFVIAASDETTNITTGTAKAKFRMPYAFTLTAVRASLSTAQTAGSIFTVDINEGGTTILSTKLTIDNNELTSTTAATAPVISDTALADDAEISIDVDQVGTAGAKGLKVVLIGYRP